MPRDDGERFSRELPKFLTAFQKVRKDGHFDNFFSETRSIGGAPDLIFFKLQALGYLPNREADKQSGVGPVFDPSPALESIVRQAADGTYTVEIRDLKVEDSDWCEGSEARGRRTNFVLDLWVRRKT